MCPLKSHWVVRYLPKLTFPFLNYVFKYNDFSFFKYFEYCHLKKYTGLIITSVLKQTLWKENNV